MEEGQQELGDDNAAGAADSTPLQKYMQLCNDLKTKLKTNQSQLEILEELRQVTLESMTKQAKALPLDSLVQYTRSLVNLLQTKHSLSFEGNSEEILQELWKRIESTKVPKTKRPGIGVAVFVLSEKHPESILLGRRKNTMGHGLYQVPGGHLEFGESWEQAAYREVLEETGLHVHNVSLCSIVDTIEPEQDYHYMTVFMRGYVDETRGSEPRNMEPNKCEGWLWWKWSAIPTPDLLFWCLRDFKTKNLNPF
uniref:Nucleotide triphosphate diphosphatase NUDT15 n=1 Tax=Rhipicephalus zambeziensis TaxID=60191 RepID=A0A224YSG4_9ACAR